MTIEKSKTEYLKRYLGEGKKKKKKPKKTSNTLIPKVKILNENIDIKDMKFGEIEIEEEEEAPVVAEVIDERPEEVKLKEIYEPSKWKRLETTNGARNRPSETLSGLKAGLQNAATLRKETQDLREREKKQINLLDEELSGRNAETIVRDRKSGKKRDFDGEYIEKLEKEKKQAELQEKYSRWGKGIEQNESQQQKLSEDLYESLKPLARYQGDEDLEEQLKAQIHDDDPMANYIKKKKKKEVGSAFPKYKGPPPPPNRFGIKPGYRWDRVDRSNGFEKKYFEKLSSSKASQEEAYLWSVQDM